MEARKPPSSTAVSPGSTKPRKTAASPNTSAATAESTTGRRHVQQLLSNAVTPERSPAAVNARMNVRQCARGRLAAWICADSTVDIPTRDGSADAFLPAPDGSGPYPGVLFYMDAFGPRPRLEEMAARIADEGYVVLVPHVFYRQGRAPLVDTRPADGPRRPAAELFETLGPWMQELTPGARDE